MSTETLLPLSKVAKILGLTRQAIWYYVRDKKIPVRKKTDYQFFIHPDDLDAYLIARSLKAKKKEEEDRGRLKRWLKINKN